MKCLHFVGFTNEEQIRKASRIFGEPHFIHPKWDVRAEQELDVDDVIVYANGTPRRAEEREFFLSVGGKQGGGRMMRLPPFFCSKFSYYRRHALHTRIRRTL
jgi:hypothetical protein